MDVVAPGCVITQVQHKPLRSSNAVIDHICGAGAEKGIDKGARAIMMGRASSRAIRVILIVRGHVGLCLAHACLQQPRAVHFVTRHAQYKHVHRLIHGVAYAGRGCAPGERTSRKVWYRQCMRARLLAVARNENAEQDLCWPVLRQLDIITGLKKRAWNRAPQREGLHSRKLYLRARAVTRRIIRGSRKH